MLKEFKSIPNLKVLSVSIYSRTDLINLTEVPMPADTLVSLHLEDNVGLTPVMEIKGLKKISVQNYSRSGLDNIDMFSEIPGLSMKISGASKIRDLSSAEIFSLLTILELWEAEKINDLFPLINNPWFGEGDNIDQKHF